MNPARFSANEQADPFFNSALGVMDGILAARGQTPDSNLGPVNRLLWYNYLPPPDVSNTEANDQDAAVPAAALCDADGEAQNAPAVQPPPSPKRPADEMAGDAPREKIRRLGRSSADRKPSSCFEWKSYRSLVDHMFENPSGPKPKAGAKTKPGAEAEQRPAHDPTPDLTPDKPKEDGDEDEDEYEDEEDDEDEDDEPKPWLPCLCFRGRVVVNPNADEPDYHEVEARCAAWVDQCEMAAGRRGGPPFDAGYVPVVDDLKSDDGPEWFVEWNQWVRRICGAGEVRVVDDPNGDQPESEWVVAAKAHWAALIARREREGGDLTRDVQCINPALLTLRGDDDQ